MSTALPKVVAAVVPAAGLGSRLRPLTLGAAKELLPLGRYPALVATLLEAAAAAIAELVIVGAAQKPELRRFLDRLATADPPALRALTVGCRLTLVEQPQPLGTLDAVARGLAALPSPLGREGAVAVLFPDLVQLPNQTALQRLVSAQAQCGGALFGLRRAVAGEPSTSTLAVELADPLDPAGLAAAEAIGQPLRIVAIGPAQGTPGELLTTFGQIQTPALSAAIEQHCRPQPTAPLDDRRLPAALAALATAGGLYGTLLPGEILDLGSLPGYLAALRRFIDGSARLRDLP